MIGNAFNSLLFLHSIEATIERPGQITARDIKVSPSNYYRNLQGVEEIVMKGREFVISRKSLDDSGFNQVLKRGDVIRTPELGKNTIVESREMFDLGGRIIGYRVRTE